MATIKLGLRYKAAFGYVTINESESLRKQQFSELNGLNFGVYNNDASFEELTIKKTDNDSLFFGNMLVKNTENEIYAPPPMISFSKAKTIVETEIDGTDAVVVERYGDKQFVVKIQGLLVDMLNHAYPRQQVKKLREFFDVKAPFAVESEMFDLLNIRSIYFTDIEIGGVAGFTDTVQYTLTAKSIKPVQFFFTKNNR